MSLKKLYLFNDISFFDINNSVKQLVFKRFDQTAHIFAHAIKSANIIYVATACANNYNKQRKYISMKEKPMEVITFATIKGGIGKTTLSYNYGEYLASKGHKVLLMDLDQQSSLSIFQ